MSQAHPVGLILAYHRIDSPPFDRWAISVSPKNFSEHLDAVRRTGVPMRLSEMVHALADRTLPDRAVAITFDDGYSNNLSEGKPALERYDIPATVFLCSGLIGSPEEFWWDELELAMFADDGLPDRLKLSVDGAVQRWDSRLTGAGSHSARRSDMHDRIWETLRAASPEGRKAAIGQIRHLVGGVSQRPGYRPMDVDEVDAFLDGGLISIGSHTVSHRLLPTLGPEDQRHELAADRAELAASFGRTISGAAYPHGGYNHDTLEVVREEDFAYACTTRAELVSYRHSLHELPRICPGDWSGDRLMSELRNYGWPA